MFRRYPKESLRQSTDFQMFAFSAVFPPVALSLRGSKFSYENNCSLKETSVSFDLCAVTSVTPLR